MPGSETVTIEQIRKLEARLLFLRVKCYYRPWRLFGRGRVRRLVKQRGCDVVGWVSGMDSGAPHPEKAYVMVRPSWTGFGAPDMYVRLRDIHALEVLAEQPGDLLPGQCSTLEDLASFYAHPDRLDDLSRLDIELHLQWCRLCQGTRSAVAKQFAETLAPEE